MIPNISKATSSISRYLLLQMCSSALSGSSRGGCLGYKVSVLDAAVLLKAGWDKDMHEVWVSVVPPQVSIQRVKERDGVSDNIAQKMLNAQSSSTEAVRYGHVVFCSLWEPEYTQKQVERENERMNKQHVC